MNPVYPSPRESCLCVPFYDDMGNDVKQEECSKENKKEK